VRLAVAYLRVSTEKQEVEAQRRAIEEFAKQHGFEVLWFEEPEGTSGAVRALERPVFRQMWQFLESNPHIRDLIVFELTRLGRDYDDLKSLLAKLSERGIRLWIVTLPTWNEMVELARRSDNPVMQLLYKLIGDIVVSVMSFTAAQERVMISLRTKAGLAKARTQGKRIGRPAYPFPEDKVRMLLAQGKSIADAWRLLKENGEICRARSDGSRDCMEYETFRKKVRQLIRERCSAS